MEYENYVYKKEVDWSLLHEGLTLPVNYQVIFSQNMGRFLLKGEVKNIKLYLEGLSYQAKITNVNYSNKYYRKNDVVQIRYGSNSDLSKALRMCFYKSYKYLLEKRESRPKDDRKMIRVPDYYKEYLVIYTTEYDDTYILDPILSEDINKMRQDIEKQDERVFERSLNYDVVDREATFIELQTNVKMRKLNRSIGENLKLLYQYRCQICGLYVGENYSAHVAEAHHIDFFVHSMNNDINNQMILCPNHHSIIHDVNPIFDRKRLIYIYSNGYREGLILNKHL